MKYEREIGSLRKSLTELFSSDKPVTYECTSTFYVSYKCSQKHYFSPAEKCCPECGALVQNCIEVAVKRCWTETDYDPNGYSNLPYTKETDVRYVESVSWTHDEIE